MVWNDHSLIKMSLKYIKNKETRKTAKIALVAALKMEIQILEKQGQDLVNLVNLVKEIKPSASFKAKRDALIEISNCLSGIKACDYHLEIFDHNFQPYDGSLRQVMTQLPIGDVSFILAKVRSTTCKYDSEDGWVENHDFLKSYRVGA